jgi:hypothetical protein
MSDPDCHEDQLLRDAKAKAEKLIASLIAQRDDLDRFTGHIAPEKIAQGRKAFADAIGSTRKTLDGIEKALRAASHSGPETKGI